jgi:hypothetical protein
VKSRLLELLRDLPLPDGRTGAAFAWDQILILDNIGRVPSPVAIAGDFLWNRGFKALLLDGDGAPVYLCKCRAPGDAWLRRETEIRARLCAEAGLEHVVPWTGGTRNHLLQVQVSRYVSGALYQGLVPKQTLDQWATSIRSILSGAHLACTTYEHLSGQATREPLQALDVAQPFLRDLAVSGVPTTVLWSLEDCLRNAPPFRSMVQHGDLWPRNIIHDGQSWWLLDFEYVGETLVPLYDVYQLLRTSVQLRRARPSGIEPSWFECMSSGDDLARTTRALLRSTCRAIGIDEDQAMGCLACYLVEVTGRLLRRRAPPRFCRSFVTELEHVGTVIKSGADLKSVFWTN